MRPHPHIGLATITYLFEGEIMHRDSLGCVQRIQAGEVNLMTAGRGIVHSERAGEDLNSPSRLHGIQSWIALPDDQEECEPAFVHYSAGDVPELEIGEVAVRLIIGAAYEHASPVQTYTSTLCFECRLPQGTELRLPESYPELAAYIVAGDVQIDARTYTSGVMAVASPGKAMSLSALTDSHVMVIGGDPVGDRYIWWNLVSSSKDRIEQAKTDWQAGRFTPIPGDTEFIPLPDSP